MWNQELEVSTRLECLRLALQTVKQLDHPHPESVVNYARFYFEFATGKNDSSQSPCTKP